MTANNIKSYILSNNNIKSKRILKLLSLKLMIESELLNIKIFSAKVTLKIGQEKYSLLILC